MLRIKMILLIVIMGFFQNLKGQDIHFVQQNMFPNLVHPSTTGIINDGYLELGVLHRNQVFTITSNPYETSFLYLNCKIDKGFSKNDHIGIGLIVLNDQTGIGQLTTNKAIFNLAYHKHFKNPKQWISIGTQTSYNTRNVGDWDAYIFEEDLLGTGFIEPNLFAKNTFLDLGLGISYHADINHNSLFEIGFTYHHLNQSESPNSIIEKYIPLMSGFVKYDFPVIDKLLLQTDIRYNRTEVFDEINVKSNLKYSLPKLDLKAGVGWRYKDAIEVLLGVDIGPWEIGFVYEKHISNLALVSDWSAALEFGVKYTFQKQKEKPIEDLDTILVKKPEIFTIQLIVSIISDEEIDSIPIVLSSDSSVVDTISTSLDFSSLMDNNHLYTIAVNKQGYDPISVPVHTYGIFNDTTIFREIVLKKTHIETFPPIVGEPIEVEKTYALKNILYDFDDDKILPIAEVDLRNLLSLMNEFPSMIIELSSHTDCRGIDLYNERLSQRRADSATSWLLSRGISPDRIISKGYGEYKLINHCMDGIDCSKEEHQQNRRTEFKILKM